MKKIIILILLVLSGSSLLAEEIQWASFVHSFSSQLTTSKYSAGQILNYPSVMPGYGESECAWTPLPKKNNALEWIIVEFSDPIFVQQIAIHENLNSGALSTVIIYDSLGNKHNVYKSLSIPRTPLKGRMNHIFIDRTEFRVFGVKLTYNIPYIYKAIQVDAVAIADTREPVIPKINLADDYSFVNEPEKLGANVNSKFDEIAPVISPDGSTLYFTRMFHPDNVGKDKNQDIWLSKIKNGKFERAELLPGLINNQKNNFIISVTPDGNKIMIGNTYNKDGSMGKGFSFAKYSGVDWGFPEKIEIADYYNQVSGTSSCLANNGKVILVSLQRKDGYGLHDIFATFLQKDGTWSKPSNLGKTINTAGDEATPFLAADNKTLYFASDGHCGYGRIDIFATRRLDDTWQNWSKTINIGQPLNSDKTEGFFSITASGDYAYFSRSAGKDKMADIYRIKLPESLKPESVVLVSGRVFNQKTMEPVEAKIIYETLADGKEIGIAYSNPQTGEYKIVLPGGQKYGFLAEAKGFIAVNENIDLVELANYGEINKDLYLVPIEIGQTIRMNNIFFDTGEYELLANSYSELKRIIKLLKQQPNIKIQINGHTDDIGSSSNNMTLSKKRAYAVSYYLAEKGCDKSRLAIKGFGETKPVVKNTSAENRQQNRRVEFVILED
jgi:OmpA-OmpF porin, OOP family